MLSSLVNLNSIPGITYLQNYPHHGYLSLHAQHQVIPLAPLPDPPCRCSGEGCTPTRRSIDVKIPAGVDNGNTLRLRSMGSVGKHGGQAGDLFIRIQVRSLAFFTPCQWLRTSLRLGQSHAPGPLPSPLPPD